MHNTGLINFRIKKQLTTEQMAQQIGVSESFYKKIEYGFRNPSYNFQKKLKHAFPDAPLKNIV